MAHYIDADRLREELQKPKTELKVGNYYLDNSEQAVGYENALIDFELLIDSLQQEQPGINETEVVESDATIRGIKEKLNTIIFIAPDEWKPGDKVEAIITRKEETK